MRFRAQMLRHLALLLTFSASVASAHMKINKTAPEEGSTQSKPPEHIQLWFTQAPDLAVSKVELTGPAGDVELGKPQTMDDKSLMAAVTGEAPRRRLHRQVADRR